MKTPSRVFLAIALFAGFGFAIATPPMRFPDEAGHYLRAAKVAAEFFQHDWGARNVVWLPQSVARDLDSFTNRIMQVIHGGHPYSVDELASRIEFSKAHENPSPRKIPAMQMQSDGVGYFPQVLAFEAVRRAGGSFAVSVWIGRLAVLIVSVAITVVALELMPPWARWTGVALSLLPMAAYLRASLSPDAMVSAMTLLGIAALLDGAKRIEIAWPSALVALLACVYLAAVKPPYVCILLLSLLWLPVGMSRRPQPRTAIVVIAAMWAATLSVAAWHSHDVAPYVAELRPDLPPDTFGYAAQLHMLVTSPLAVAAVFAKTLLAVPGMAYSMIARFGWADINPYPPFHVLVIGWCIGVVFFDRYPIARNISLSWASILLSTFISQVCIVILTFWLTWTETTASMIPGIQGRYFLPALICGALGSAAFILRSLLPTPKDELYENSALMPRFVAGGAALLLAGAFVFVVLGEFYGIQGFHVICLHEFCKAD